MYQSNGKDVYIPEIKSQIERTTDILNTVSTNHPKARLHLVAHSKGCILTAAASPRVTGSIIFLAPPEIFDKKIEEYFKSVPGTKIFEEEIIVPRKDGTYTHIPKIYFKQSANIDAQQAILKLSQNKKINLLQATNDEVLGITKYEQLINNKNIEITSIPADHNFKEQWRKPMIKYVLEVLS